MKEVIELTKEQISLFKSMGTVVNDGDTWYFLPFWFKKIDDDSDLFEVHHLGQLPESFKWNVYEEIDPNAVIPEDKPEI